jgi:hypothetical protein
MTRLFFVHTRSQRDVYDDEVVFPIDTTSATTRLPPRRRPWSAIRRAPWPTQRRGRHSRNARQVGSDRTDGNDVIDRLLPWYQGADLDAAARSGHDD